MSVITVASASARPGSVSPLQALLRMVKKYTFAFALVLSVILFIVNGFQTGWNIGLTAQLALLAPTALAAMASAPPIISGRGGFDLSISPIMVMSSSIYVAWLVPRGIDGTLAIIIMLAIGAAIGAVNGLMIVGLRIPPVVATLSMYFILQGVDLLIIPSPISVQGSQLAVFAGNIGPIPGPLFLLLFPLVVWWLLGLLPYRSLLTAVGSNDTAAYSAGVKVALVRGGAYVLGGFFAGAGGVAIIAATNSASAALAATYALPGVAAVALGGTSLLGGRGGLFGPLLGAAAIFLLGNLFVAVQVNPSWLQVMYGSMLIVAVVFVAYAGIATGGSK